jgi:hypothetical protein
MDFISNMGWLGKTLVATVSLIPVMIFFNTFVKQGMKPEVVIFTWMAGTAIGIFLTPLGLSFLEVKDLTIFDFSLNRLMALLLLLAIVFGSVGNIMLGQAIPLSPNPALPFAIAGLASVIAYVLCPVLAIFLPKFFPSVSFNWINLLGLIGISISVAMIMYKSPTT